MCLTHSDSSGIWLFKRCIHYKGNSKFLHGFCLTVHHYLFLIRLFQKTRRKKLPANAPTKMAMTKPPKKVRQVRSVRMFPESVSANRLSFNNRKVVIHSPRKIIMTMNVSALRRRPAQERSSPGSFWLRMVAFPDLHNWMILFFIVQSWVNVRTTSSSKVNASEDSKWA